MALSTTEAEYVALTETCKEMIWCQAVMNDFHLKVPEVVVVLTDSQSCIKINNPKFSGRTKHIDIKYHFVRELVENERVNLEYVPTNENIADMFTKPLTSVKIQDLRMRGGLRELNLT